MIRERVMQIVSGVLEMPLEDVTEETAVENTANWDSLQHMNLIIALESEFRIKFSAEQIVSLLDVRSITSAIEALVS